MKDKPTASQIAERILYIFAAILVPSIPVYFLYNRNKNEGILFSYCLIFSAILALVSLAMYLLISKFLLKRRRSLIIVSLLWVFFWSFNSIHNIALRFDNGIRYRVTILCIGFFVIAAGFVLRWIKVNRLVANTLAMMLCFLFLYNLVPGAWSAATTEITIIENKKSGNKNYEIKTEFDVSPDLPKPNIYWLHMDSMVGFDSVEKYFGDPQTELKSELETLGFVINNSARLEAGSTLVAIPALMCPGFFDSSYSELLSNTSDLVGQKKLDSLHDGLRERGIPLDEIYTCIEIFDALSEAGYTNIYNSLYGMDSMECTDIKVDGSNVVVDYQDYRDKAVLLNRVAEFKNLYTEASFLSILKTEIDSLFDKLMTPDNVQPLPDYQETVDKYKNDSDFNWRMIASVKTVKYAANAEKPSFLFINDLIAHANGYGETIGPVTYDAPVGWTFYSDENGNFYTEPHDDPLDVKLYLPQHKYTVKHMMAMIDVILEDDPDAVIVIQADHGIHKHGINYDGYDYDDFLRQGYSYEDMANLQYNTISAVRIPEKYGTLTEALDPLDIARYLVNNFVGENNYEYLYYKEED